MGEIDHRFHLTAATVDGERTRGQIDRLLYDQTGATESGDTRQARWLDLANHGFVLLESTDLRQHVDCIHPGAIRDRLDYPCPRRRVHVCGRREFCAIDAICLKDPRPPAPGRLRIARVAIRG